MILGQNHQIQIGPYKTYDDWKLVPTENPTVAAPEVKTEYIEIPGFSVRYDFTEAMQGSTPFGARTGEWEFHCVGGNETLRKRIENAIHGKRFTVIVDGVSYQGRVFLTYWENHGGVNSEWSECTISYDLDA